MFFYLITEIFKNDTFLAFKAQIGYFINENVLKILQLALLIEKSSLHTILVIKN